MELSAFGPGYGESLLVHLGDGQWMLVDSCLKAGRLPALDYLGAMGIDPAAAISLVVATHWHDDHVRGISKALAACPQAGFACSAAISRDELISAIGSLPPTRARRVTSGVREMRAVLEQLGDTSNRRTLKWAMQDRMLLERTSGVACRVLALAPCDRVLADAFREIAELVGQGASGRVPRPDRNLGAVVLWVEVGDATILLGSDLQETGEVQTGWTAVIGCRDGKDRRGEVFKVPHHGSGNGHQPRVWREMLVDSPEAVVCPHERGKNRLPSAQDLERLCKMGNVHLTAGLPSGSIPIRRGRPGRLAVPDFGRVTLRRLVGDAAWRVDYAAPASRCCLT